MCENTIYSEVKGAKYTATFFSRGCGSTTGEYHYLNIRRSEKEFDFESKDQLFIHLSSEVSADQVNAEWNDNILLLHCKECLKSGVVTENSNIRVKFSDLAIEYEK
ncbi:MAG: hypothetical protein KF685_09275 [Acidobacteria bacterium]|nr:hypothetical protein [Acidobacteriota bacterium]